jgi:hypothetical protein
MQALVEGTTGDRAPCPDAVPEETVREIVAGNIDAGKHTRAGALVALREHPAWVGALEDRLLAILDEGDDPVARRMALAALYSTKSETFARRLPRYVHDRDPHVRSEAVTGVQFALAQQIPLRLEGALVSVVRNEAGSEFALGQALLGLRNAAGRWLELDPALERAAAEGSERWRTFLRELFERGESGGTTRDGWAKAWFQWLAGDVGLQGDAVLDAVAAWEAFWRAADAGDLDRARQILAEAPRGDGDLFLSERAWLETR